MVDLGRDVSLGSIIGMRVRSLRVDRNLSAGVVAEALGIDAASFEVAERGEQDFTADQIVTLSEVLDVNPSWFFEDLVNGFIVPRDGHESDGAVS